MPDHAFKRFGKYEIQAELGRGGFGRVFRAFDPTVGRLVAIKILTSEAGTDLLTRFRNEATAAGNLRHENIVTIYEFGEEKGVPFIAMEYLEGEDLQQTIASGKTLTLLEKVSIMSQTAAGLDCAHRNGVVHRDVKPANIRLLPDGAVKIMDFGIARLIRDEGARLTRQGHVIGTLLYMAPEQVMGSDTDSLCDIFAFGVTFYELLTARHPFRADDPRSTFYKITSEDPEAIHLLVPECPETLDHVIRRAVQKDRELRYQTLRDLRLDVEPVLLELRRERASTLIGEAHNLVNDREFERGASVLSEAIGLDPANQSARQLRDDVQTELRRQVLRPRIDALITKATQSLADGNYADAIQTLNAALRLAPDDETLQLRSRDALLQRDQSRESSRLTLEARSDLAEGDVTAACSKASEAAALDPKNVDARTLLEIAQQEMEKRQRRERLEGRLAEARELVACEAFGDAVALLNALDPDDRDTRGARELLMEVQARIAEQHRKQRFQEQLTAARDLLDAGRLTEAVESLQHLHLEFPAEVSVGALLESARRESEAAHRAQAIAQILADAARLQEQEKLEEALALLEPASAEYSDERLSDAVTHALDLLESKRRKTLVMQVERDAQIYLDAGDFETALQVLDQAVRDLGEESSFTVLREAVVSAKAARQAAKQVEEAVRTAIREARELQQQGDLSGAIALLHAAIARFPGKQALVDVQSEIAAAKATHEKESERAAALRAVAAHCAELIRMDNLAEAGRAIQSALQEFPKAPELLRIQETLKSALNRKRRAEATRRAADNAQALLEKGQPARAIQLLEAAAAQYPDDTTIETALENARQAHHEQRRTKVVESVCQETRVYLNEKDFQSALRTVEVNLAAMSGEPKLIALRETVIAARQDFERSTRETPPQRAPSPRRFRKPFVLAGTCALALLAGWLGFRVIHMGSGKALLRIQTEPVGAVVRVGSMSCSTPDCRIELPPGKYTVEGSLTGFAKTSREVLVHKGDNTAVNLVMAPLPVTLAITSNFENGTVFLDGKPMGSLNDGQFRVTELVPGEHRVRVAGPDGEASLHVNAVPAHLPQIEGSIAVRAASAVAVASMGTSVEVRCAGCDGTLLMDGKPLDGRAVDMGNHELSGKIDTGALVRAFLLTSDAPTMALHLISTANPQGTLVVEANMDGASVFINRRRLRKGIEGGRLMVPLEPNDYTVEVQKPGYRVNPERMIARIRKGDQFRAAFRIEARVEAKVNASAVSAPPVLMEQPKQSEPQPASVPPVQEPARPSAVEIESGEWIAARSSRDRNNIHAFLQKYPNSAQRQEASELLAQLDWDMLDRTDRSALERFAAQHRGTQVAQQASADIQQMEREAAGKAAAATAAKHAEDQISADRGEIGRLLTQYSAAFDRKDLALLKSVWPGLPESALAQAFRGKGEIRSQLRPVGPVELMGDKATVRCLRITEQSTEFGRQKPVEETHVVYLRRENSRWVISAIN